MSALFMFAVIVLAVAAMVIAISKFKQHPFIVLMLPQTDRRRIEQLNKSAAAAKGMSFQMVTEKTA